MGFIAKGAYDLVDESILFGATDISLLRTPLWIPQGLWAFGIGVFLLLIVLLLVESLLLVLAGRGREAEALLHARTYQEEAAEALEAVGVARDSAKDARHDRDPVPAGAGRPHDRAQPDGRRPRQRA